MVLAVFKLYSWTLHIHTNWTCNYKLLVLNLRSSSQQLSETRWTPNQRSISLLKVGKSSSRKEKVSGPASLRAWFNRFDNQRVALLSDSTGTKLGGKPGGRKPFKQFKTSEKRPGKTGVGGRKDLKPGVSKGAKRKLSEEGGGEKTTVCTFVFLLGRGDSVVFCLQSGPEAKKKRRFKAEKKPTKEELKKNRQQKKKELKKSRQQAERKDMFDIISRSKQVWGDLRR